MKALQTHTHNNIATLLYSPWEKIDVKSHSKVRSRHSALNPFLDPPPEVEKTFSLYKTLIILTPTLEGH